MPVKSGRRSRACATCRRPFRAAQRRRGDARQPLAIPVGLFSDGPTTTAWNVDVDLAWSMVDASGKAIPNGTATVSLDHGSGLNGDVVNLSVTPTTWSSPGVVYLAVRSLLPGQTQAHETPILIGQP